MSDIMMCVKNVNHALHEVLYRICVTTREREMTRNGPVVRFPGLLVLRYMSPRERVYFEPLRDANPFFHFMESLWMLAGRNDVAFVSKYVQRMSAYSDDGATLNGAYGYRWRVHFDVDQLKLIINELREVPNSRRAVLGMWDPRVDLPITGKSLDVPCNLSAVFEVDQRRHRLNMTVFNRSNDIVWGMLGANAVHFSYLQEYVASALGYHVGEYVQVSTNAHIYVEAPYANKLFNVSLAPKFDVRDLYGQQYWNPRLGVSQRISPYPKAMHAHHEKVDPDKIMWMTDLYNFMEDQSRTNFFTPFFNEVVSPIAYAHQLHKHGHTRMAVEHLLEECHAIDWMVACVEWLERRRDSK